MEGRRSLAGVFSELPLAQQIVVGAAVALVVMGGFLFFRWVSEPSYTVLYTNLDDQTLAAVVEELERADIPYRIEGGGSRVLVPRAQVYEARAGLAAAGVRSEVVPQGYERLDEQGLNVSEFMQDVNYQRALEGELARTLMAMEDIGAATVHLVMPERALFAADEEPPSASVLVDPIRPLDDRQVETIVYLVAGSVEGLTPENVTVADVQGTVLHAVGDLAGTTAITSRNLRMTREYEAALAADVQRLLTSVLGAGRSSVVVRATLDFDEVATERERYEPDSAVALRESVTTESFDGTGTPPGGTVGVDGAPQPPEDAEAYTYDRNETVREYGVDRTVTREVSAPGVVEGLSAAVLVDDGSLTGAAAPDAAEIERIVAAALGIDEARGDEVAVSLVAFPAVDDAEAEPEPPGTALDPLSLAHQAVGGLVLLAVVVTLLLMARSANKKVVTPIDVGSVNAGLPGGDGAGGAGEPTGSAEVPAAALAGVQSDVMDLVQRQPEEIAVLLRGWLADRR